MRPGFAQRALALAAVALLAGVASFAIVTRTRAHGRSLPRAVGSYVALAGSSGPAAVGHRTACGGVIEPNTEGVAHPTLPCGMRIYLTVRGRHVLTEVIDHGPIPQGREFDLTDALAQVLGLSGVEQIRWSYASSG